MALLFRSDHENLELYSLGKQRTLLCFVLFGIVFLSFTGEIVDYNEGLGWDGVVYYGIVKDFGTLFKNQGIDSYHMTRILPFMLNHYILVLLNIEITIQSALICAKVLNSLFLALLVYYFLKISDRLKWNRYTELIAFSFCFLNFPVLKNLGYYPMSSDCPALLLSYMGLYYYICRNNWGMSCVAFLSLLTWPITCVIIFILALFPRDKVIVSGPSIVSKCIKLLFVLFIPVCYFTPIALIKLGYPEFDVYMYTRYPKNNVLFYCAIVGTMIFYAISMKLVDVNWLQIFRSLFSKSYLQKIVLFLLLFVILFKGISNLGGEGAPLSVLNLFRKMIRYPTSDVLIFLETPFLYLGLFFLLIILLWGKIVDHVREKYGIGYFFVLLLALLFLMNIETRMLTSFYPIMLIPLMDVMQKMRLKTPIVYTIPVICLICSFFWFPINTQGIGTAFNGSPSSYMDFPAQRYFMFFGPWQSHQVYLIVSFVEIIIGIIIVLLWKKGFLVNR